MSYSNPVGQIALHNLGKAYKRYPSRWARLAEWLWPGRVRHEPYWVLRHLHLQIAPGQAVGIIGSNGAGKSTLLKLLVGTSAPSEGSVQLHGRVAALLELGMGFHPDFSGRQNVWMAAQLLGLSDAEIAAALPHIEAFAEIGHYIDEPVRTYSSGMQVRLAFSVATAVRPDILIVDEALAVGDAYFQHKCFARIRAFRAEGSTLLFVSHDVAAIKNLCDRALLLDAGQIVADDVPGQVLDVYNALIAAKEGGSVAVALPAAAAAGAGDEEGQQEKEQEEVQGRPQAVRGMRSGDGRARIVAVEFWGAHGPARVFAVGQAVQLRMRLVKHVALAELTAGFVLRDRLGNEIYGTNTWHVPLAGPEGGDGLKHLPVGQEAVVQWNIAALNLGPGSYTVSVALHGGMVHTQDNYDWWDQAALIEVVPGSQPVFAGVCYLPGVQARLAG